MIDAIYEVLAALCAMAGLAAAALMWRNAIRWGGRKKHLRMMSGTVCLIVAVTFAAMFLFDLPNESEIATIVFRPAWLVMLSLAASFSIADL